LRLPELGSNQQKVVLVQILVVIADALGHQEERVKPVQQKLYELLIRIVKCLLDMDREVRGEKVRYR
jgi:hypothetical protein